MRPNDNPFDEFDEEPGPIPETSTWRRRRGDERLVETTRTARRVGITWKVLLTDRAWRTAVEDECDACTGPEALAKRQACLEEQTEAFLRRVHTELAQIAPGTSRTSFGCWFRGGKQTISVAGRIKGLESPLLLVDIEHENAFPGT